MKTLILIATLLVTSFAFAADGDWADCKPHQNAITGPQALTAATWAKSKVPTFTGEAADIFYIYVSRGEDSDGNVEFRLNIRFKVTVTLAAIAADSTVWPEGAVKQSEDGSGNPQYHNEIGNVILAADAATAANTTKGWVSYTGLNADIQELWIGQRRGGYWARLSGRTYYTAADFPLGSSRCCVVGSVTEPCN